MLTIILTKFRDIVARSHQTLVNWEMRWRFRNFKPQLDSRKLRVDEIDMGVCGRWQATDDYRIPPPHTNVKVSDYNKE